MPNCIWNYFVKRRHVSTQTYKPQTGAIYLYFNYSSIKPVKPHRLAKHVAVTPAERHLIMPWVINNYSGGTLTSSALPKRSPWNTNSPNGALHDMNAGSSGMLQERNQAGNWLVHTIGTLFINGYYGCRRAWAGQLTLCMGRRKKRANYTKKITSVASWECLQAKFGE